MTTTHLLPFAPILPILPILPIIPILPTLAYCFTRSFPDKHPKVLTVLAALLLNPYLYTLLALSPADSLQHTCTLLFLTSQLIHPTKWSYLLIGVASALNPSAFILAIQTLLNNKNSKTASPVLNCLLLLVSLTLTVVLFPLLTGQSLLEMYSEMFFPRVF